MALERGLADLLTLSQTKLNQFHAEVARDLMVEAGYSLVADEALFGRVKDLLLKRNLARPPLPEVLKGKLLPPQS